MFERFVMFFGSLIFGAIWIAIPILVCVMLWRFLRAYERRNAPGEVAELRVRVLELERRVAELTTEQSRFAHAGREGGASQP